MLESVEVSTVLPVSARRLYEAWLDGTEHAAFTGGAAATCEPFVGGSFTAWDGYIDGTNLELEPYRRIVQSWRSSEFPEGSVPSRLEVLLEEVEGGTRLTLRHEDIPAGQGASYRYGWLEYYFKPMAEYYGKE